MGGYILRRLIMLIPTVFLVSVLTFIIIELPPGDFLTSYIMRLESSGQLVDEAAIEALEIQYGLNDPLHVRYLKWAGGLLQGQFGQSLQWQLPVRDLIGERLALTFVISLSSLLFIWAVAFPIGVYSAIRRYSPGDYLFTAISFIGLGIPDFLLALIVMWLALSHFGISVGGLFSQEYADAPWSLAKIGDLLSHLWIPMFVVAMGGTAGLIRIMRANLLDELRKPYVVAARSKGIPERRVILRYPVRVALNPFISTVGWTLPGLVSGSTIVAVVLNLPTTGPLLLQSLLSQDMFLAGTLVMMLSILTVIGTLISDILLAWLDPRIRLGE
jgi:peptide/nickel transport system permease protein